MWDQKTGRSRGFGFDAQSAINDLMGKWLGSRQIRCNWGTKGAGIGDEKHASDSKSVVELTNGSSEEGKEPINSSDAPENNPQYTTVYVGNLAPELDRKPSKCVVFEDDPRATGRFTSVYEICMATTT
ncbi:putative nucleotide-binding alpha-beta plait domain superfamily, RNA-binding domain superfamily [Helianthus annuus]|nr:putative nucleotide-binding alpha-beta plait domain superfamily, RNA-binding domain superfamily [Helianthus annuus]